MSKRTCPFCFKGSVVTRSVEGEVFPYLEIPNLVLDGPIEMPVCDNEECGEWLLDKSSTLALEDACRASYERRLSTLMSAEVISIRALSASSMRISTVMSPIRAWSGPSTPFSVGRALERREGGYDAAA